MKAIGDWLIYVTNILGERMHNLLAHDHDHKHVVVRQNRDLADTA